MRSGCLRFPAAAWGLFGWLGCGVLGPPGGDAQYPAVRIPASLPAARSSSSPASPAPAPAAPVAAAPPAVAEGTTGAATSEPARVRLLRPGSDASAEPEPSGPAHGYLPDPPPLSEQVRWLYQVRYDRGVIQASAPELECLERPVPSARRIGRFAFELWLGAELIDRIRFDFPLLAAEVPRQRQRRPLHEEPSFAPGARVSTRLQIPASTRATRAQILDRATGRATPVPWPPRAEAPAQLCTKTNTAPTPTAR
ncbi:MAG: hypothetical protein ABI895_38815 [Deltaproteobacteria bacterium]